MILPSTPSLIITISLVFLCACSPNSKSTQFPGTLAIGTRPESITKGFDGDYFVTVMGEKEPGDAYIARIQNGEISKFAEGMDEPKGIAFDGTHLYATDLRRVWKIDASGEKSELVGEADFPVAISYLNDAAISPDGSSLYITDMGANDKMFGPDGFWPFDSEQAKNIPVIGRVFKIDLSSSGIEIAVDANDLMPCPNGVGFGKDGQLLIGAFFRGNFLEAHGDHLHVIADGFRGADAVEQDSKGNYYVSSWKFAKVWKIDGSTKDVTVLIEGLQSAADFYLNEEESMILLPDMLAGTITRIDL
ncbi:hypothetical protein [Pelagicoccus sp. SDUM812002]|uniref:SMP-30/gluconolactonase/LRE family protein n=1 Tax=Pelagicoccus sp. SDUM812002 TaxID=3041266 RepID=UPI00280F2664|nr:hypothetical protein [Pelagicoccus sp. SDUM812002]MDQ8184505.1 hypothetical protein [Pelagicoccus sp. SDUM812002]